jgi:hypothetical protein
MCDCGAIGVGAAAVWQSAPGTGLGIDVLAVSIRQHLVPEAAMQDPRPWAFWDT